MGRFFPYADLTDIVRNMKHAGQRELQRDVHLPRGRRHRVRARRSRARCAPAAIALERGRSSRSTSRARSPRTDARARSASSGSSRAPRSTASPRCAASTTTRRVWAWNKVLVFNLGFDAKGQEGVHWAYYPSRETVVLPGRLVRQHLRHRPPEPLRRARVSRGTRPSTSAAMRERVLARPRARGGRRPASASWPSTRWSSTRPTCTSPSGRSPSTSASGRAPRGARRLVARPLRRLDLLRHRGQHRRGARRSWRAGQSPSCT